MLLPVAFDRIRYACKYNGVADLTVLGLHVSRQVDYQDEYLVVRAADGSVLMAAADPDPRFGSIEVLETNWAMRLLAVVYVIAKAAQAELDDAAEDAADLADDLASRMVA